MIPIPNDYGTARAYDGTNAPQLTPGGHICRIRGARMEKTQMTNRDMLVIAFDICEGSAFDDYYKAAFERRQKFDNTAKWPGMFRTTITTADGRTNSFFKGFITAVEESNQGYSFTDTYGDERALNGRLVGFNFGEEEYEANNGETRVAVKPFYAVSVGKVREGIEPPPRKTLNQAAGTPAAQAAMQTAAQRYDDEEDDLPF